MIFHNTTHLDTTRLEALFLLHAGPWPLDGLTVVVRYTRSTPFSGLCSYRSGHIHINLGRRNKYPFELRTHVARPRTTRRGWWRPVYIVHLEDAYQLALFLFMHELYHWLVKKARRNTRQKEGRCDRFAVRTLVDGLGLQLIDANGQAVERAEWDFQDLDGFVVRALRPVKTKSARSPTEKVQMQLPMPATHPFQIGAQLTLFG